MVTATPGQYAILALLALIPVAVFLLDRADPSVGLSVVSLVVLAGCLYYMFSTTDPQSQAGTSH